MFASVLVLGTAAGAATPVTGAVLILEADAGITTSGATVTGWADQSGTGNDLVAVGDPTIGSAPTGAAAIEFDGAIDRLEKLGGIAGLPTGNSDRTVFFVADYMSPVSGFGGFAYGDDIPNQAFGTVVDDSGNLTVQGWGAANDFQTTTPGVGAGWTIQTATLEGNVLTHRANGVVIDGPRSHNFNTGAQQIRVAADLDGAPQHDMAVAAIIVYDRALSEAERVQVQSYLSNKYLGPDTSAPAISAGQSFFVRQTAPTGTAIGTVAAVDNLDIISMSIVAGDPSGAFAIDADGQLSVADAGALASGTTAALTVQAQDAAGNVGTEAITVGTSGDGPVPGAVFSLEGDFGVLGDAGNVNGWFDQGAPGNDLVAVGNPLTGLSPSGLPTIEFDGSGDRLEKLGGIAGLPTGNSDRTVFFVAEYMSPVTGFGGFSYGDDFPNRAFGTVVDDTGNLTVQGWDPVNDFPSSTPGVGAGWLIQTATLQADVLTHHANGALIGGPLTHVFNTGAEQIRVAADLDGAPQHDMAVAAILVYDRALTDVERMQVEAYLDTKYLQIPGVAPDAMDDAVTVPGNSITLQDVLSNDIDVDGDLDPSTLTVVTPPAVAATVIFDAGMFVVEYTAPPSGSDSFVYEVCDLTGQCDTATVTVSVSSPPVVEDDTATVSTDTTTGIDVLGNDLDDDDDLDVTSLTILSGPSLGSAMIVDYGSGPVLEYVAPGVGAVAPAVSAIDVITYEACDLLGTCDTATLEVTIQIACTIHGTSDSDFIIGTAGDDVICAYGGNDIILASWGDDIVIAGGGSDAVWAGKGDDVVYGGAGRDRVWGWNGDDMLFGGAGPDILVGGWGYDTADGQDGHDRCYANIEFSCEY